MRDLLKEIRACQVCSPHLVDGVNPVLSAHAESKIAVIGQAPGVIVHRTGIPWNDKSGERLRQWLHVTEDAFYNPGTFALIPMGFCYPGKGKSGDLPPRKECAPLWHSRLFEHAGKIRLTLLIGAYAQDYYLGAEKKKTLTETVRNYRNYLPEFLPLPHPSPRNNIWLRKNSWFEGELLPVLREKVKNILQT
ncbi:MAG: uracil-DNA glycosylase family protein [Cytophagales bacterium]|nr:uracil-DNA glycosylase family protein [Cytophagales bacterium]